MYSYIYMKLNIAARASCIVYIRCRSVQASNPIIGQCPVVVGRGGGASLVRAQAGRSGKLLSAERPAEGSRATGRLSAREQSRGPVASRHKAAHLSQRVRAQRRRSRHQARLPEGSALLSRPGIPGIWVSPERAPKFIYSMCCLSLSLSCFLRLEADQNYARMPSLFVSALEWGTGYYRRS